MGLTKRIAITAALVMTGGGLVAGSPAQAAPDQAQDPRCNRNNDSVSKLLECVTLEGVMEHQKAFQAIADANNGHRASGSSGYNASVGYVMERMRKAGYSVSKQAFDYNAFEDLGGSTLAQTAPGQVTYTEGEDFSATDHSDPGSASAAVTPVDIGGRRVGVTASVGVTVAAGSRENHAEGLLREADVAMYQAKAHGRNRVEVYDG